MACYPAERGCPMETYLVRVFPAGWNRLRLEKFLSVTGGVLFTRTGRSPTTAVEISAGQVEGLRKKGFDLEKA